MIPVAMGIVVSLLINDWNETRNDRKKIEQI